MTLFTSFSNLRGLQREEDRKTLRASPQLHEFPGVSHATTEMAFRRPEVEKPEDADRHDIYIYYPYLGPRFCKRKLVFLVEVFQSSLNLCGFFHQAA